VLLLGESEELGIFQQSIDHGHLVAELYATPSAESSTGLLSAANDHLGRLFPFIFEFYCFLGSSVLPERGCFPTP
jgi:hypothetical protein